MTTRPSRTAPADLTLGVIGGSGLYEMDGLTDVRWVKVRTPFGPSAGLRPDLSAAADEA